jgi:hypothetical protein
MPDWLCLSFEWAVFVPAGFRLRTVNRKHPTQTQGKDRFFLLLEGRPTKVPFSKKGWRDFALVIEGLG